VAASGAPSAVGGVASVASVASPVGGGVAAAGPDVARAALPPQGGGLGAGAEEKIPVQLGGVTSFILVSEIWYAEAHGDYARLFTRRGSHLVRASLGTLEERWRDAGFVRIHRSHLVAYRYVEELRHDGGTMSVRIGEHILPVSRRHAKDLRNVLLRRAEAAPGAAGASAASAADQEGTARRDQA
jgi:hypothetical protein